MRDSGEDFNTIETQSDPKKRGGGRSALRFFVEFIIALAIAFALTWLVKTFVIQPFEVPSGSMEPTIMTNDRILAEKITYSFNTVKKGDVIVFADKTQQGRILVKRVIALPGQTVSFDGEGNVLVDGSSIYEPYTKGRLSYPLPTHFEGMTISYPYTVPENCVWVMGDNRTNSADSRYFGSIDMDSIEGRVVMIFWPPSDISLMMDGTG